MSKKPTPQPAKSLVDDKQLAYNNIEIAGFYASVLIDISEDTEVDTENDLRTCLRCLSYRLSDHIDNARRIMNKVAP